jgi:peptidoglycan hydrolase-like protein with peptidoglycan-binding domain
MLRKGSSGSEVEALQQFLVDQGYDLGNFGPAGDGVDGQFGSLTDAAVRQFQSDTGIGVDGIVGPITQGEIDKVLAAGGEEPPPDTGGGDTSPSPGEIDQGGGVITSDPGAPASDDLDARFPHARVVFRS